MRAIPDLMLCLQELHDGTVTGIRKTAEDPPRVAVYDVLQAVTGCSSQNCSVVYQRLSQGYPDVLTKCCHFKFSGQGQRETPVAGLRTIVEIIMVLPGRAAARVRKAAADVMVRYLGGDPSLVEEIAANRLTQEQLDEGDPARIFGQTVESEALKRKREQVTIAELDGREKRARVQAATDVAGMTLRALQDLGLPVSDRDKMLAKDIITTAAFTSQHHFTGEGHRLEEKPQDRDICLQQFCAERGKPGNHISLGKKAKKLYLEDHPGYTFPKKDVYANGQIIQANRWTESMRGYLERGLQLL
jgi:hypothetical protein